MRVILVTLFLFSGLSLQAQTVKSSNRAFDGAYDGQHILNFMPFGGVVAYGKANPTIGFDYEYIFKGESRIGLHLPIVLGYQGPEQGGSFYYGSGYKYTTYYAAPGVRFHAQLGGGKNAELVTGPAIILGNMHFRPYDYYYGTGGPVGQPFDYSLTGIMADNSINFYHGHFVFGFDARVGSLIEVRDGTRFFMHIGMHFGGVF